MLITSFKKKIESGDNRWIQRLSNGLMWSIGIANDFMEEKVTTMTSDECKTHISELNDKFNEIWFVINEMETKEEDNNIIVSLHNELDKCQSKYTQAIQAIKDYQ